jgi:hypothetical protein
MKYSCKTGNYQSMDETGGRPEERGNIPVFRSIPGRDRYRNTGHIRGYRGGGVVSVITNFEMDPFYNKKKDQSQVSP